MLILALFSCAKLAAQAGKMSRRAALEVFQEARAIRCFTQAKSYMQ